MKITLGFTFFWTLLGYHTAFAAFIDQPPKIVNLFWAIVGRDQFGEVTRIQLEDFFRRYDDNNVNIELLITETMFQTGNETWRGDFNLTTEVGKGNFLQLDRRQFSSDEGQTGISNGDLSYHISVGDGNADVSLNETEFKNGYNRILRSLPFAVMFTRFDADKNNSMIYNEYDDLYRAINKKGDEKLTSSEMETFFESNDYAKKAMGKQFFDNLKFYGFSTNNSTLDRINDWRRIFEAIDTARPLQQLSFIEFEQLDNMMYKEYNPDGKKKLTRRHK